MVGPPAFGTVTREAVPQQIVSRLLDLIQQRHLGPGDRLPAERELAASMGVSRSSLREALRALTVLGVTEMRHGTGTYISSLEPELLVRHADASCSRCPTTPPTSCSRRAGWSSPRWRRWPPSGSTTGRSELLDACVERAGTAIGDAEAFMETDLELHDAIRVAAENAVLGRFMESIRALGLASRRRTGARRAVQEQTVKDHRAIVAALRARDPEAASAAMHRHLENVERA